MKKYRKHSGFTIVELVIVIVVIAILASIAVVSYRGVQSRATKASLNNDIEEGTQQLELKKELGQTNEYPSDLSSLNDGQGFRVSGDNQYKYTSTPHKASSNPAAGYCLIVYSPKYNIATWVDVDDVQHDLVGPSIGQNVCTVDLYDASGNKLGSSKYVVASTNPLSISEDTYMH